MALETRILKVRFNSNYSGLHRVCYREQGTVNYTCSLVSCGGDGSPCEYDIEVELDNETCQNVIFEGYVQASCESETSTVGRMPFITTFEPEPRCGRWRAMCQRGGVEIIGISNGGSGYTSPPTVLILSGNGVGASATAVLTAGTVTSILVNSSGQGYSLGDTVLLSIPPSGIQATAFVQWIGKCSELELTDCSGNVVDNAYTVNQRESVTMCSPFQITPKSLNWVVTKDETPCLCSCGEYKVTSRGGATGFMYYNCETESWNRVFMELDESVNVCASSDSWSWYNEDEDNTPPLIEYVGPCQ